MTMSDYNIELFTEDLGKCCTILKQQIVMIKAIKSLMTSVDNINESVVPIIEDALDTINGRIDSVKTDISTLQTNINNVQGNLSNHISSSTTQFNNINTELNAITTQLTNTALTLNNSDSDNPHITLNTSTSNNYSIHATESDGFYIYRNEDIVLHIKSNQITFCENDQVTITNPLYLTGDIMSSGKITSNNGITIFDTTDYKVNVDTSFLRYISNYIDSEIDINLYQPVDLTSVITEGFPYSATSDLYDKTYELNAETLALVVRGLLGDKIRVNITSSYGNIPITMNKLSGIGDYSTNLNGGMYLSATYIASIQQYPIASYYYSYSLAYTSIYFISIITTSSNMPTSAESFQLRIKEVQRFTPQ